MFKKRIFSDRKILVLVRLLDSSKRFLVFLVLFGLIWNLVPWNALYAKSKDAVDQSSEEELNKDYPSTTDADFDYKKIGIADEDVSLRTDNTKTFRRKDGSHVVSVYNDSVHYLVNGKYEDINNSFDYNKKEDVFENQKNAFAIKMPKSLDNNKKIKLTLDKYSISWTINQMSKTDIQVEKNDMKSNNIKQLTNISQKVTYRNIKPNVDLEYIINGNHVKENIILEKFIENFEMSFQYEIDNLVLIEKNGNIVFTNDKDQEIFSFGEFFAVDNLGETTDLIDVSIENIKKNVYEIRLKVDREWLRNANYPVVIDPTINSNTQSVSLLDTYVYESKPDQSYAGLTYMIVSNTTSTSECQGLISFQLPQSVMNKQITYATLTLHRYSTATTDRTIGLYKNNTSFTSNVTWNTKPATSYEMTDYHIIGSSSIYEFNITKTVREWQSTGNTQTTGFTIRDKDYYGGYNSVRSQEYAGTTYDPVIEIGYINPAGLKDYWTYSSHSVGEHSQGYVSDFTGLLNIVRTDSIYQTEKQTLGISFAYNIDDKSLNRGYYYGWNIIYNKTIGYDSGLGLYYSIDYTGNQVFYHQTTCDSRFPNEYINGYPKYFYCHIAEDGSKDMLARSTFSGSVYDFTIRIGKDVKEVYNVSGFLMSIINEKTNQTISIERSVANPNHVTKITDSSGNKIENTYTNGFITSSKLYTYQSNNITPYLLEEVNYNYSSIGNGQSELSITYKKNYDSTSMMAIDDVLKYTYDSYYRIVSSYVPNKDKVVYNYKASSNKIDSVTSLYGTFPFAQMSYEYKLRETTITYQNDRFINFMFDDFGHTVNIIDDLGNVQYFKYLSIFHQMDSGFPNFLFIDGEPNYYQNNQLISQANPQSTFFNPISNGGFEYNQTGLSHQWTYFNDTGDISYLNQNIQSSERALFGQYAAYIKADGINTGHFEQKIMLDQGVYTLTGYVKNESNSNNVWIDIVGESFGGTVTFVQATGEWIKTTITFGINNDNTEIVIHLINHSNGKAFFDNVEIYSDFIDNRTNMMDNPSFEFAYGSNNVPGWLVSHPSYVYRDNIDSTLDDFYGRILGDYALRIDGSGKQTRSASTCISDFMDTTLYQENGHLMIGAWAKSSGTPTTVTETDVTDGNARYLRIRVDFVSSPAVNPWNPQYNSTIYKTEYIYFDTSIEGWQYAFKNIELPTSYDYLINVFFEYKGEGTVYFDGLQVTFDSFYKNFEYESIYGNLTKTTTSNGDTVNYFYDVLKDYASNPTRIIRSDGQTIELDVDDNTYTSIRINNVLSNVYKNDFGQTTSTTVGENNYYYTKHTSYTHLSQFVSSVTNEYGNTTNFMTDTLSGLLKAITNAKGQDTHYLYDNEGKLIKVVSVDDHQNYNSGDEDGLVEYLYDSEDRLWRIILGTNYYYELSYDNQGRIENVLVNNQLLMNYTYIIDGMYYSNRISNQTFGNGDMIKFEYNMNNQVDMILFKEANGIYLPKFSYEYDQDGRIAVYNTYQGYDIISSEYYTYDASGHLSQVVDQDGNLIQYLYNTDGDLTSLKVQIDGKNATTNYQHYQCLVWRDYNECLTHSTFYDKTTYLSAAFNYVVKDYNYETTALHRLDFISLVGNLFSIKQNFIYTGNTNRILEMTYQINGIDVDYKYNYGYDALGNIIYERYYEGVQLKLQKKYDYDALNQLNVEHSRDYDYSLSTLTESNYTKIFKYDHRGNITDVKTYLYEQSEYLNPVIPPFYSEITGPLDFHMVYNNSYTFDSIYQLQIGQTPINRFTYFDTETLLRISGVTTTMIDSNLDVNTEGYYYSRFVATKNPSYGMVFDIIYKVGNPTPGMTIPQEHYHYNYDVAWKDQLISYGEVNYINGVPQAFVPIQIYTYDTQGNPIQITHFMFDDIIYSYAILDWSGRTLRQIKVYQEGMIEAVATITYRYNDEGYRIEKKIERIALATEIISYTLLGDKVIYETNGTYSMMYHLDIDQSIISFTYDPNVNVSNDDEDYFYLRNQMGDITHILDGYGNQIIHYVYDAYGKIIKTEVLNGYMYVEAMNRYRYRGYQYDDEIGWYYLNSRYYNPEIGRFISSDGLLGQMGDILSTNMYAYCGNNPVMYSDITGYAPEWLKWTIGGIVIAGCLAAVILSGGSAIAFGAFAGSLVGGITGLVNGISLDEDGFHFDSDKASTGFMFGSIVGAISGSIGAQVGATSKLGVFAQRSIMASVNGTLSLGVYISKAAIDGDSISFGGAMIALGSGLFSFADPTGYKVFDAFWGPMMGAELGWTYDLLSDLYRKSNTSTRILTYY